MLVVSGEKVWKWLTLITGLVECLFFAGILAGWPSLVFVLKTNGYFSDHCVNTTEPNGTQYTDCSKQDELFSLDFTIAAILQTFILLLTGIFFDRFGTMATRLVAIILFTAGALMFAFSNAEISLILFPAVSFIGFGAAIFHLTNIQVANLFDAHRSTVVTLFNGAFSSAAITFLLVKVASEGGIPLRNSFLLLSAYSIIHLIRTFFLMPKMHIPYPLPEGYTYGMSCEQPMCKARSLHKAQTESTEAVQGEMEMEQASSEEGDVEGSVQTSQTEVPFKQCALSWLFLWHLVWTPVMALRHILYFATLNPMLTHLAQGDLDVVSHYTNVFAFTQLCGILCAPLNGLIIDRFNGKQKAPGETDEEHNLRSVVLSLFLTALQCLLFAICVTIPVLPLQYLTFVLQVINFSFVLGGTSAYIAIVFPACYFGKLFGLMNAALLVVYLLQFPCVILLEQVLHGDPLYINIALCFLCLTAFIHPAYVYIRWRRLATKRRLSAQTPTPAGNSSAGDLNAF